ncbi:hypothetical protein C1Y22_37415, partial [Pseudomonas sp. MPR-R2A5]|uniref:hypothetical protein n=1 Tax=Pseudomonas sp. MPR-R2A5 TaxID=2070622 RepID=UPI000CC443A8
DKAIPRAANEATARHLRESRRVISLIMDGKYVQPTGGGVDILSALFGIQDTPTLSCGRP